MKMNHHLAPPNGGSDGVRENAGNFFFIWVAPASRGSSAGVSPGDSVLLPQPLENKGQGEGRQFLPPILRLNSDKFAYSRLNCFHPHPRRAGVSSWSTTFPTPCPAARYCSSSNPQSEIRSPQFLSRNIPSAFHHVSPYVPPPNPLSFKAVPSCSTLFRHIPPSFPLSEWSINSSHPTTSICPNALRLTPRVFHPHTPTHCRTLNFHRRQMNPNFAPRTPRFPRNPLISRILQNLLAPITLKSQPTGNRKFCFLLPISRSVCRNRF